MEDTCTYLVVLCGHVDIDEVNLMSPLHMAHAADTVRLEVHAPGLAATASSVRTDQSGIIGLMRYLHGLGIVVHSIARQDDAGGKKVN